MFADAVLKRVCKLAQLNGAAAQFVLESRLNGHHLLLGRGGLLTRQSDMENVRSPVANRRPVSRLFYGTLTWRLRRELLPHMSIARSRSTICQSSIRPAALISSRAQPPGDTDRMSHLTRARMSLRRNDIATSGVVRTNRGHCWPQSVQPASDDREDSATAAPRGEATGTGRVHRPQT